MLKALANVAPRHLLDTRLNPPAELRARAPKADAVRSTPAVSEAPAVTAAAGPSPRRLRVFRADEVPQTS
jgi:hypothetical protein